MTAMNKKEQKAAREKNQWAEDVILYCMQEQVTYRGEILARLTGYSCRVIDARLRYMEKFDFVRRVPGGWRVT